MDVEHAGGWMTRYAALQHLLTTPGNHRRRRARVHAGDVLGHARRSDLRVRFAVFRLTDDGWIAGVLRLVPVGQNGGVEGGVANGGGTSGGTTLVPPQELN